MLSERVNRIALSPTLRISARALAMRAQGIDVVDFSAGEPDFPTPEAVKRAKETVTEQLEAIKKEYAEMEVCLCVCVCLRACVCILQRLFPIMHVCAYACIYVPNPLSPMHRAFVGAA